MTIIEQSSSQASAIDQAAAALTAQVLVPFPFHMCSSNCTFLRSLTLRSTTFEECVVTWSEQVSTCTHPSDHAQANATAQVMALFISMLQLLDYA